MDSLSPSSTGLEALAEGNQRTIFTTKSVESLQMMAGLYMVIESVAGSGSGRVTVVTIVSDVADADAVAAYFDVRDAAGGAMEDSELDLSQAFDDVIAKQDSSTWHQHQVPLSNRQLGLVTSGIDSYSGQLAYVVAVEPEWMDIEVVGVAEDAQTVEWAGGAEVVGGAEAAVADTVEFSVLFACIHTDAYQVRPSAAGFDSSRARILGRRAGGYRS